MNSISTSRCLGATLVTLLCAGCAVIPPSSPTLTAVPTPGKNLSQFQQEDYSCRDYAAQTIAGTQSAAGSSQQHQSSAALQVQLNNVYAQCITAKGNTVVAPQPVTVMMPAPVVMYAPRPYYYLPY